MKKLIPLLKKVEIEYRCHGKIESTVLYNELADLSDWDYRIVQDFILRVKMYIQNDNTNFVFKKFQDSTYDEFISKFKKYDLMIASLRRDEHDTVLTDIRNRLVIPKYLTFDILEVWGLPVTQARNFAVNKALEAGCKYLLFVDDDMMMPNNALQLLFERMESTGNPVVAANYYRKVEPLISAHGELEPYDPDDEHDGGYKSLYKTDLCAMGFTLIDLEEITRQVPLPLFWEFGAEDGYWSMGEDAFFTKNVIEYTGQKPLVDCQIKSLHYDKTWKRIYGKRDNKVVYASNQISNTEQFERIRVPNKFPKIGVCIPTRKEEDPIACDLSKLKMLRGYQSQLYRVNGLRVDLARQKLVEDSIKDDCDYILFVDDDVIPPEDGLCNLLETMEKGEASAVSGCYKLKGNPSHSIHLQLNEEGMVTELDRLKIEDTIVLCNWMIGLGFCLIDVNCFKELRKPWFLCHSKAQGEFDVNEDSHFSELMIQSGYKIFIDQSIECQHVDFKTKTVW